MLAEAPYSNEEEILKRKTQMSTPITEDDIRREYFAHNLISLIKFYRERTGLGLKDAKEAIDRIFNHETGDDRVWSNYRLGKVLELFQNAKYVGQNPHPMHTANELKVAIDIMYSNWNNLGYTSFKAGVQAIMGNF